MVFCVREFCHDWELCSPVCGARAVVVGARCWIWLICFGRRTTREEVALARRWRVRGVGGVRASGVLCVGLLFVLLQAKA